jgi:hypothetical protein
MYSRRKKNTRTLAPGVSRLVPRGDPRSPGTYAADRFWEVYASHGPWWAVQWMREVNANLSGEELTIILTDPDFFKRVLSHPVIYYMGTTIVRPRA